MSALTPSQTGSGRQARQLLNWAAAGRVKRNRARQGRAGQGRAGQARRGRVNGASGKSGRGARGRVKRQGQAVKQTSNRQASAAG